MCEFGVSELQFELVKPMGLHKCTMGHGTMTATCEFLFYFFFLSKKKKGGVGEEEEEEEEEIMEKRY